MNYYIADLHLGHHNILNFDHRPFSDIYQMEDVIAMYWNATVKNNDTVYILGDFCWGKADEWRRVLKKLQGHKVLIEGNHDLKTYPSELKAMFDDIKPYKEVDDKNRKVILSHYPILFYKHSNDPNYFMLCGHIHATKENEYLERFINEMKNAPDCEDNLSFKNHAQIYNVGAMMPWMSFVPRTLDEIIRRYQQCKEK